MGFIFKMRYEKSDYWWLSFSIYFFISAEFGDYQEDKNAQDYFKDNALFPKVSVSVLIIPFWYIISHSSLIYETKKYFLSDGKTYCWWFVYYPFIYTYGNIYKCIFKQLSWCKSNITVFWMSRNNDVTGIISPNPR